MWILIDVLHSIKHIFLYCLSFNLQEFNKMSPSRCKRLSLVGLWFIQVPSPYKYTYCVAAHYFNACMMLVFCEQSLFAYMVVHIINLIHLRNFLYFHSISGYYLCPCSSTIKKCLQKDQQGNHGTTIAGAHLAFRLVGKH